VSSTALYEVSALPSEGRRTRRRRLTRAGTPVSRVEAYRLFSEDAAFRNAFLEDLRACPFEAYFWETPPLTAQSLELDFEWVLVESPELAGVGPDARAFAEHLDRSCNVRDFWNLGHDAILIAPCRAADAEVYPHLATFARAGPEEQVHHLFREVGRAVGERIAAGQDPLWVSTSGLGIYWLHVRLDSRPKYYTYMPYRELSR